MAVGRKKRFLYIITATFLLSFFWHRHVFQDTLINLLGKCSEPAKENISVQKLKETVHTPRKIDLQSRINGVFNKIQNLIPNTTFTYFNRTTSGSNSKAFIVNPQENYCVGQDLVVQLDMYDHLGNRKTHGGDFIMPRLFSPHLKASMSGRVEDFNNGSYHVHFPLYWEGKVNFSILLWHPSEGVAALWRSRHSSLGVLGFNGMYESLGKQAISNCSFKLHTKHEVCEYKDEVYEEIFYCIKPRNITCDCLTRMRAVDLGLSYLIPEEKQMFQRSNVAVNVAVNVEAVMVTDCNSTTLRAKCQTGMSSPLPSGYFFNDTWNPVYCSMTTYKTGEDFTKCLQGKKLFLIGDSTLRQYIMHLTEGIKIVKYFRHHETGWHSWQKTLEALNMEKDIYVSYKRHGFPLESFLFYYFMEDMYTSRQIDQRGGGKDTIFVITMGQHFRQFPLQLYIKRALNIRRALERLFLRSLDTKVIIKTENTRGGYTQVERTGDFHGYTQYLVLKEVFQGMNVGFVDAWDMTVASATESVHPPGATFASIMSMTFTFACQ